MLGATSIEKIPKSSASGQNFLDPLPPSSKKGSTDENVGILYLIPYFGKKPNFTNFVNWGGPLAMIDTYLPVSIIHV